MPLQSNRRIHQKAHHIKVGLANCLTQKAYNPQFRYVNITQVLLSRDCSQASVYCSVIDSSTASVQSINQILVELNKASGFFQRYLAGLRRFRHIPKLKFYGPLKTGSLVGHNIAEPFE